MRKWEESSVHVSILINTGIFDYKGRLVLLLFAKLAVKLVQLIWSLYFLKTSPFVYPQPFLNFCYTSLQSGRQRSPGKGPPSIFEMAHNS